MQKRIGRFTISIDVELGWGECDKVMQPHTKAALGREREAVRRLLALFNRYDVVATWAIVGHLLVDECQWQDGMVHPEIPRPIVTDAQQDWFFQHPHDPADSAWYARDMVETILRAQPKQEIASHSFCHAPYDEATTNRQAILSDIEQAVLQHQRWGLPFEIFIFPRNQVGYLDLLQRAGITVYRGNILDAQPTRLPKPLVRLSRLASFFFATEPPTVSPQIDELGLVNIPGSMLLLGRRGLRRLVTPNTVIRRGRAGLDRAVKRGEIFHLWLHPSNLTYQPDEQFFILEAILKYANQLRAQGALEIQPMGKIPVTPESEAAANGQERDVALIRAQAVARHDADANRFESYYREMEQDYFSSSFTYGRQKLHAVLDAAIDMLPRGSRLLDVGCGTGEQLKRYADRGFCVVGIEPSSRMRRIAQEQFPTIPVLGGSLPQISFRDASFDGVIAIEVLRYLHRRDVQQSYREMLRVLRPGGLLIFTMVNKYATTGFYVYDTMRRMVPRPQERQITHCEFVTPRQVESDLAAAGAVDIKCYGRLVLPWRAVYKLSPATGARVARRFESWDDSLSAKEWAIPFTGHLIVVAKRA